MLGREGRRTTLTDRLHLNRWTDERAPDLVEPILGYRAFSVCRIGRLGQAPRPTLVSPQKRTPWPHDDWLTATCKLPMEDEVIEVGTPEGTWVLERRIVEVPHEHCFGSVHGCGIHAARLPLDATPYLARPGLLAAVHLAGKVIPGARGFRAQRARPVRLLYAPSYCDEALAHETAHAYGIPIVEAPATMPGDPHGPFPIARPATTLAGAMDQLNRALFDLAKPMLDLERWQRDFLRGFGITFGGVRREARKGRTRAGEPGRHRAGRRRARGQLRPLRRVRAERAG